MTVSCVGPSGRGEGDEVVAEVDEGTNVLPVVEEVILCVPTGEGRGGEGRGGEWEEEMR